MLLENKYSKWYYSIISNAKTRILNNNIYSELHHIVPESFFKNRTRKGPSGWLDGNPNNPLNKVNLTPREHFICHLLLIKFTTGVAKSKMVFAAAGMKRARKFQHRYVNSRLYSIVRQEMSKQSSILNKGRKHSEETRKKVSDAGKGRKHSEETKKLMSEQAKGKKKSASQIEKMKQHRHSDESKKRMSDTQQNRKPITEETRDKMSLASLGKPKTKEHAANISKGKKGIPKPPMPEFLKKQISEKLIGRPSSRKGKKGEYKHSEETKQKIIESNKRRVYSDETRAKLSVAAKANAARRKSATSTTSVVIIVSS
jgi:hypothetical protein